MTAEERIKKADETRRHKEIIEKRKAESRQLLKYEADAINKLVHDAKWEDEVINEVDQLGIVEPTSGSDRRHR